jgi:hypothetical protein
VVVTNLPEPFYGTLGTAARRALDAFGCVAPPLLRTAAADQRGGRGFIQFASKATRQILILPLDLRLKLATFFFPGSVVF